ncbi:transposase family protein [Nonomuraea angiospora]|uniref:transposase family protein n=1 Tax=Nonomuraea angiospora TaxID=46172 RepID=UPI00360899CB
MDSACPACGGVSERVHSRYERRLCDAAIGGQGTLIHLLIRKSDSNRAGGTVPWRKVARQGWRSDQPVRRLVRG